VVVQLSNLIQNLNLFTVDSPVRAISYNVFNCFSNHGYHDYKGKGHYCCVWCQWRDWWYWL